MTKENSKADGKKTRKLLRFSFLSFGSSKNEKNFRFSSRLWKDVTFYLKSKQIDKATESKSFLEQRQREAAKERAEKSLKWQTKVRQKEKFLVERKNFLFRLRILRNPVNFVGLTIKSWANGRNKRRDTKFCRDFASTKEKLFLIVLCDENLFFRTRSDENFDKTKTIRKSKIDFSFYDGPLGAKETFYFDQSSAFFVFVDLFIVNLS